MNVPPQPPGRPLTGDLLLQNLLLRVGRLNYVWTNTESLLIHVISGLSGMTKEAAVIVFLTLNTTRARLDLVERLAKMPSTPAAQRKEVLSLTRGFLKEAPLRNKYNHCIYSFDPEMGQLRTILMRIADRKDDLLMGKAEVADEQELGAIDAAIARIEALNRDIWRAIIAFGYPV